MGQQNAENDTRLRRSLRARAAGHWMKWRLRSSSFAELNTLAQPGANPYLADWFGHTGLCFVHIPKNGGSTVERTLYSGRVGHRPWHELHRLSPLQYERWLKFALVRDPVDRFLSSYDYLRGGGRNAFDREVGRRFIRHADIGAFVARLEEDEVFRGQVMRYFHFRPQAAYVLSDDGFCMVDRLLDFDHLSEQFADLIGRDPAAIGHRNKTAGARTAPGELSDATTSAIRRLYTADEQLRAFALASGNDAYMQPVAISIGDEAAV